MSGYAKESHSTDLQVKKEQASSAEIAEDNDSTEDEVISQKERNTSSGGLVPSRMLDHALWYVRKGLFVVPLCWPVWDDEEDCWICGCGRCKSEKSVGKRPLLGNGYQEQQADEEQVRSWWRRWPDANIGVLLEPSGLLVIDLDSEGARKEAQALGMYLTRIASTGKGLHYYYKKPEGCEPGRRIQQGDSGKIDLLAKGYVVAPPSLHRSGVRYGWRGSRMTVYPPSWITRSLCHSVNYGGSRTPSLELPAVSLPMFPKEERLELVVCQVSEPGVVYGSMSHETGLSEELEIWEALGWIPADEYETWLHVGMSLHHWDHRGHGHGRGRLLWDRWSEWGCARKFDRQAQDQTWKSFDADGGIQLQRLFIMAAAFRASSSPSGVVQNQTLAQMPNIQEPIDCPGSVDGELRDLSGFCKEEAARAPVAVETSIATAEACVEVGPLRLDVVCRELSFEEEMFVLTPSEADLLALLMQRSGEIVSFRELLERLYKEQLSSMMRERNVKDVLRQFICRIRNKLEELGACRRWLDNIRGSGYRFDLTDPGCDCRS